MAFTITPNDRSANPGWQVRLENCDHDHAKTVLDQLEADPTVPSDLRLSGSAFPIRVLKRRLFRR